MPKPKKPNKFLKRVRNRIMGQANRKYLYRVPFSVKGGTSEEAMSMHVNANDASEALAKAKEHLNDIQSNRLAKDRAQYQCGKPIKIDTNSKYKENG